MLCCSVRPLPLPPPRTPRGLGTLGGGALERPRPRASWLPGWRCSWKSPGQDTAGQRWGLREHRDLLVTAEFPGAGWVLCRFTGPHPGTSSGSKASLCWSASSLGPPTPARHLVPSPAFMAGSTLQVAVLNLQPPVLLRTFTDIRLGHAPSARASGPRSWPWGSRATFPAAWCPAHRRCSGE